MASYYNEAFHEALDEVQEPQRWFLCLIRTCQAYGGPEEGGWWYTVAEVVAFREYATQQEAEAGKARVTALADEYSEGGRRRHGDQCLREMEWCEERGLEADYLPEPDGPDQYEVAVYQEVPTFDNRKPQYC